MGHRCRRWRGEEEYEWSRINQSRVEGAGTKELLTLVRRPLNHVLKLLKILKLHREKIFAFLSFARKIFLLGLTLSCDGECDGGPLKLAPLWHVSSRLSSHLVSLTLSMAWLRTGELRERCCSRCPLPSLACCLPAGRWSSPAHPRGHCRSSRRPCSSSRSR